MLAFIPLNSFYHKNMIHHFVFFSFTRLILFIDERTREPDADTHASFGVEPGKEQKCTKQ